MSGQHSSGGSGNARSQRFASEPSELAAQLADARQELGTLRVALDNVQGGLLLLDGDLRARYSNPALHSLFKSFSTEQIRSQRPHYQDLLRAAANAEAIDVNGYIERRLNWVRSGDPTPMDIEMTNGTVVRCQLAILPDGGRMLIYSDVTDIVRNAQELEKLATIDGMTGIYNRRHFLYLADREWDRARRYRRPLSFLMIDIDHFKTINDRFGHSVGDSAIVHVASLVQSCRRGSDLLARIGGEEFGLLLPETRLGAAQQLAERLRLHVAESTVPQLNEGMTISIGVAAAEDHMSCISDLMKLADQALYAAKRDGRNQVVCGLPANVVPLAASSLTGHSTPQSA